MNNEFDAELYFALVEKMTVCDGGRLVVSLLGGTDVAIEKSNRANRFALPQYIRRLKERAKALQALLIQCERFALPGTSLRRIRML